MSLDWDRCRAAVDAMDPVRVSGRIEKIVGLVVEAEGLAASVGALCRIERGGDAVPAEIVGFRGGTAMLMPYGGMEGLARGQKVFLVSERLRVPVGDDLLGRVIDAHGRPLDGGPPLRSMRERAVTAAAPPAMSRRRIERALPTGVRSIDSLITVAQGQRLGVFAGSGVGKSVLLGMLARNASVDVNVVALIGERGREVREFIERDLGPEGLARSVVVVVTSDESAVMRARGAETAMAVAEHFRDRGRDVLLMMDSITRYAMALREIGLAAGEPPTTKGYTPSVFAALPRLCERAGMADVGSITAFFTVLIEGDDIQDPVGDAVRSILDGHVMLSRDLAREGHYPAVDVLGSISRLRQEVAPPELIDAGRTLVRWLKALEENRDLINIGAYVAGSDPVTDAALKRRDAVRAFLTQSMTEPASWDDTARGLLELAAEV
ncbi:MAG TPA: FliI/YscN family ATPase [Candidatus Krumholzibacteria bacterium]|nr:FliI/YscN family ATPase [Candidatus Krumholzibacteria bacterium]HRX50914.1 FliI/YscN family ATPase [Candidatus Krumholzibacteria bacterium]